MNQVRKPVPFRLGRMGPHQHSVSARFIGRLHHQFVQVGEHILPFLGVPADIGGHIGQYRVLARIVFYDFRNIGIDHLVVGNPRARRVGHCHPSGPVDLHDARNPQHRIGPEDLGVDEVIVDPAVEYIHPGKALCGPHMDESVDDHQVPALHEFDAHLLGKEGVFEIGRVVDARRQHADGRILHTVRCEVFEHLQKPVGVIVNGPDIGRIEDLGECPFQHLPVFQHIGDPRRASQVVLQHIELAVAVPHQSKGKIFSVPSSLP